ncbi:hypothetical protein HAX54_012446 [Datura stramonium]|uniref:Serine-threonine/tyrosine-protein kinase catalytic domain-containing protein n=1 Tax=Datura stramonium TaxID=4076 RepID=A0ABS8TLD7_DATST|nr:hypothetical protein [Datura stramonium]
MIQSRHRASFSELVLASRQPRSSTVIALPETCAAIQILKPESTTDSLHFFTSVDIREPLSPKQDGIDAKPNGTNYTNYKVIFEFTFYFSEAGSLVSQGNKKADVYYSFGGVAMEILCGRKNVDYSHSLEFPYLLSLFMEKAENNQLIDMIRDYSDDLQCNTSEVVRMMKLAVWCLQSDFTLRPSMSMAVKRIDGTMYIESHLDYSVTNHRQLQQSKEWQTRLILSMMKKK